MFYYILSGNGQFIIDEVPHRVSKGDLICIPKGSTYQDDGNMEMLSISSPKFDRNSVIFSD
jgi:mannose-6-phosphate isomerase-like protein (cupin superfamily)